MPRKKIAAAAFLIFALLGFSGLPVLSGQGRLNEELLNVFGLRNLGPFRCGSWVTDFAVPDQPERDHLYTFYVATRNGGLWKTVNNGTTFTALFDDQPRLSIGAVAVASSNPDVVWVGTGEAHCARSSNHGDGVYRSLDGGRTWKNMGLVDSQHVARIRIHPQNPDVVYVAAMGHLFSPNRERGIFKTADGGKTWENVLFISERVGAVDLVLNPANPDILYAAAYEKERLPWHFEEGGPGSGIYKSADAGKTWTRLAGGLPSGKIGRIGLDIFRKNSDILYAVVENANPRLASAEEAARDKLRGLAPQARTIGGEIYRSADAGKTWTKMNDAKSRIGSKAPYSFNQLRVDPADDQKLYVTGVTLAFSADGGRTWRDDDWPPSSIFAKGFGDVRTLWIDPRNPERIFMGSDGGVHISYDGGKTCDHLYNLPLGEFYAVGVDHGGPLQPVRRPAGPRLLEGTEQRLVGRNRPGRLDHRRHQRRHVQCGRPGRQPLGL